MAGNTERNAEIVRLRKAGVGTRTIARRLGLTPGSVSGVLNRAGLVLDTRHVNTASRPKKLTAAKAAEIRRRYWAGETGRALGKEFGVTAPAVWSIAHELCWKAAA